MAPLVTKRLITVDDYHEMAETGMLKPDENVELINGEIYTMAPIGSKHAEVVRKLSTFLIRSIIDEAIVSSQQPVHIDRRNELEPDIALLKYKQTGYPTAHPNPSDILMIMEVSDTTYDYDRHVKLSIYAGAGIPVYWIIRLDKKCIEVYEKPRDDQYLQRTLYTSGDAVTIQDISMDVADILLIR